MARDGRCGGLWENCCVSERPPLLPAGGEDCVSAEWWRWGAGRNAGRETSLDGVISKPCKILNIHVVKALWIFNPVTGFVKSIILIEMIHSIMWTKPHIDHSHFLYSWWGSGFGIYPGLMMLNVYFKWHVQKFELCSSRLAFGTCKKGKELELHSLCVIPVLCLVAADEAHQLHLIWSPKMGHDVQRCRYWRKREIMYLLYHR